LGYSLSIKEWAKIVFFAFLKQSTVLINVFLGLDTGLAEQQMAAVAT
jgi:hypothetical protein